MRSISTFKTLRVMTLFLGCFNGTCSAMQDAAANTLSADQISALEGHDSQDVARQSPTNLPSEAEPKKIFEGKYESDQHKKKASHNGSFVIAPLPMVSPALGTGIIPVLGYITPLPTTDKTVSPSVVGAAGLITNNGSRGFGVGTDLYLKQAVYELEAVYAHGNLNYDLYGVGFENGNTGLKLPLEQSGQILFVKLLRKMKWNTYVGGRFINGKSFITLKPTSGEIPPVPPDVGLHTDLRALGVEVWRDTRSNRFYPLKGSVLDFTGDFFAQDLGSKYSFQSYKFTFNKSVSLTSKQVLAYNLYWCGTGGSPPFYGNCIYGANNQLRGYTAGRYLDRFMVATQLEYRLVLPWRFGLVGFGGVGAIAPGAGQWRSDQLLPGGGTGIRYMLSKKYHVNLRTDFAWGKDNFTWSMGVGEAF